MKRRNFIKTLVASTAAAVSAKIVTAKNKPTDEEIVHKNIKVKALKKNLICIDDEVLPEIHIDFEEPDATYIKIKNKNKF